MSIEAKVKEIIVQQLGVDAEKVTAEASFVDDLGADSLDVVELVMAFEEEFDVEIPDEAAEKIANVKDAVDFSRATRAVDASAGSGHGPRADLPAGDRDPGHVGWLLSQGAAGSDPSRNSMPRAFRPESRVKSMASILGQWFEHKEIKKFDTLCPLRGCGGGHGHGTVGTRNQ